MAAEKQAKRKACGEMKIENSENNGIAQQRNGGVGVSIGWLRNHGVSWRRAAAMKLSSMQAALRWRKRNVAGGINGS
jgi:hypothetical protein